MAEDNNTYSTPDDFCRIEVSNSKLTIIMPPTKSLEERRKEYEQEQKEKDRLKQEARAKNIEKLKNTKIDDYFDDCYNRAILMRELSEADDINMGLFYRAFNLKHSDFGYKRTNAERIDIVIEVNYREMMYPVFIDTLNKAGFVMYANLIIESE